MKIFLRTLLIFILISQAAYAWNVAFDPHAPEIASSQHTSDMLDFINTFINWVCAFLSVYALLKSFSKLNNNDFKGAAMAFSGAFIFGCAPYLSKFFIYH